MELWLPGGEVHRISSQLLGVPSASSFEMMVLCSPQATVEPTPLGWHRGKCGSSLSAFSQV